MIKTVRSLAFGALALGAAFAPTASQAEEAPTTPVAVGQTAPDFTLPDPNDNNHALASLRGEKNLLMVFFRGAW